MIYQCPSNQPVYVGGWRLIDDRQLFGYFLYFSPLLSCGVGWGGMITSCLSAFHTYLPHARHCLLGGVTSQVTSQTLLMLRSSRLQVTSQTLLMLRPSRRQVTSETLLMLRSSRLQVTSETLLRWKQSVDGWSKDARMLITCKFLLCKY